MVWGSQQNHAGCKAFAVWSLAGVIIFVPVAFMILFPTHFLVYTCVTPAIFLNCSGTCHVGLATGLIIYLCIRLLIEPKTEAFPSLGLLVTVLFWSFAEGCFLLATFLGLTTTLRFFFQTIFWGFWVFTRIHSAWITPNI